MRLKANKTSLYKLTAEYIALPGMRQVNFQKATRHPDYWLKWHQENTDGYCDAFLLSSAGCPLLVITERDIFGNRISRTVHRMTVEDLRERDMIEEVADRGA